MGYYDDEIKRLKDELERCKEGQTREKTQEECRKGAETLRDVYDSYMQVGFTEEQAYELLITQLKK